MKNIFLNLLKPGYFKVMFKKIFKRFEKDNSILALKWATQKCKSSTEEICISIDGNLFEEVKSDIKAIENKAKDRLSTLDFSLGGGGNYVLLNFLVRKFQPTCVVESGVAAGWSSLAILKALEKNKKGFLYSSDFPYFRLKNPEKYIGFVVEDENLKSRWYLNIQGDQVALPKIVNLLENKKINLFHYDSDKSYSGRDFAINTLSSKISTDCIIIFDDIQDNLHFKDFVEENKMQYTVLEFKGKYVGVVGI
jgi:predicted O-methyltransferase YrrM